MIHEWEYEGERYRINTEDGLGGVCMMYDMTLGFDLGDDIGQTVTAMTAKLLRLAVDYNMERDRIRRELLESISAEYECLLTGSGYESDLVHAVRMDKLVSIINRIIPTKGE